MPHQNLEGTKFCRSCGSKLLLKDRYRAIKPIGQGGFGRTFLALDEDKPSKPRCVIKQFFPQVQGTSNIQKAAELFHQEAMRLDELGKHPQIPDLLAHFDQDGFSYLVQEFIAGSTLSQELASKGSFNETEIRQVLNDLLPVLQFVHSQEVIHRDIKPANIIRRSPPNARGGQGGIDPPNARGGQGGIDPPNARGGQGGIVLVDFGASKVATQAALQQTGTTIGSPEYVAPEQARGWAVFASDIYSLGVTCIHLLTGLSPFNLYDIQQDRWVWRQSLKRPVSEALGKILDKMIESAINRRYQSATEVLRDLNPQTPASATPKPPSPPPIKSSPVFAPPPAAKGIIDQELADVSSQFIGATPAKNHQEPANSQKPLSSPNTKSKSQIDQELEELRSQFIDPGK
ncbi:serine/threonine protein kinase [Microseira wollei NIES-4236]|uniref:non-specific serine/threonine protein kinase n=1 Tax=Microseira wollei NIES-4236 TaxID=2530354 RepID=A0AAV3X471_9CYAN|nr:serine/threonine protein kinase [Microseira wollei NIES-4236]